MCALMKEISCKMRGDCERAYVKAREDEGGRTVDVMRFLLTYGLDSNLVNSDNKLSQNKIVKESVRRLLKEMVDYSSNQDDTDPPKATEGQANIPMKQGDWLCPKCKFLNFARNVRCLRCNGLFQDRLRRLQEDQDHLPLKKGDWICEKCNFLNFAKNTRCLQCEEKPPKRQLSLGEWECESCNYINFRRNMVCLKCDHRRSKALNSPNNVSTKPEQDNGGYSRLSSNNAENEAANDKSEKRDRKNRKKGPRNWKFVEEEEDDDDSSLCNKDARYMNFPIVGGKSILSQDEQKREKWKAEMLEKKNKSVITTSESDEEVEYDDDTRGTFKYVEATYDEDMAEWFGHTKKTESNSSVSATHENGVP
ncbi:uncharacterized protein LOC126681066 isoform X2 [Mercurialis annua]|uniref:uncharacterized protein LOC126681066 isoform X2 n=1 Tax=Mercurialis annua TaxID=3986 RepID=UPI00215E3A13|nr:uncharacterized protein LOC126681066 isoform X2 [Mercurialis annua]